ncbi:bacillithiol biosynthesis cysteine-adding enzyme BshC [Chitinophaga costaii]|uniref:Putative cysteine ligase BshC n=1 Tax=Chitinophaga costaii TaxID=1335309 RepID=A0A1C4G7M7_9BACT|nr:bacillithiol biosynthesis cysteine-adding enzyme BshC [Chitinophaga costaii]PUZ19600.1 bacillithiol biosynthesis cysteine-adding enzyme BshC [Chitinophaga costaii]SCC63761.1 bacillithiol biosynthesis cysteine-adding enzyme BshC [Chitinophaga costaii]
MSYHVRHLPYRQTGYFSQLVLDFLAAHPQVSPFYAYAPLQADFGKVIAARQQAPVDRAVLVAALREQYAGLTLHDAVQENIARLQSPDTFTVCTAHQPNLFTGYLYFAYKILQAVKLAADLKVQYPQYNFVPVYYMGSEDADLEELGSIFLDGKTLTWETSQHGAVGRMLTDGLEPMLEEIAHSINFLPHGAELLALLREAYQPGINVQQATLYLVNALFGRFGLVVLVPDNAALKRLYIPVMKQELLQQTSYKLVTETMAQLAQHYKVQANPREINLFYLVDDQRERIVREGHRWAVLNTDYTFTETELLAELDAHPERFSPNVILRGMFQETVLPNLAFIGGGGEIAYWLELKSLFAQYQVPFPVLLLRNSFLWVDSGSLKRLHKLELESTDLFKDTLELIDHYVESHTNAALVLKEEYTTIERLFDELTEKARAIDGTLVASVGAEYQKAVKSIGKLEHKFLKAEKKKFAWQTESIQAVKKKLFPANSLQERKENFIPYYAQYGPAFFDVLLEHIVPVTDQFIVIEEE